MINDTSNNGEEYLMKKRGGKKGRKKKERKKGEKIRRLFESIENDENEVDVKGMKRKSE